MAITNEGSPSGGPERSVAELFAELATETTSLMRQEVNLAAKEITQKAALASRQAVMIGVGALLGTIVLLWVSAALVFGLGTIIPMWLSALLVGLGIAVVSGAVIQKGVKGWRSIDPTPKRTIKTIEEGKSWAQQQVR